MDRSPSGSSVHEILQARILVWVAIFFSRDLADPGIKLQSPALPAVSLPLNRQESPSDQEKLQQRLALEQDLIA